MANHIFLFSCCQKDREGGAVRGGRSPLPARAGMLRDKVSKNFPHFPPKLVFFSFFVFLRCLQKSLYHRFLVYDPKEDPHFPFSIGSFRQVCYEIPFPAETAIIIFEFNFLLFDRLPSSCSCLTMDYSYQVGGKNSFSVSNLPN